MKCFIIIWPLLFCLNASAQSHKGIFVIDFVRIKNDKGDEASFFYNNNWKVYRDTALKRGYISSYQLLRVKPDSLCTFDFILVTGYADSAQYSKSELNFNKIIKELRPGGPKLLDSIQPADFRENIFSKIASNSAEAQ